MAAIPHTALLSHSKLLQGKFLHRNSPIPVSAVQHAARLLQMQCGDLKPFANFERERERARGDSLMLSVKLSLRESFQISL